MSKSASVVSLSVLLALAGGCAHQEGGHAAGGTEAAGAVDVVAMQAAIAKLRSACVVVEYTLQYDKADSPGSEGGDYGRGGSRGGGYGGLETYVKEERPLERPGYLIGPDKVATGDVRIHPRFIKSIQVRAGNQLVAATLDAVAKDRSATVLKLGSPLKEATPLAFDKTKAGPYIQANFTETDGVWSLNAGGGVARSVSTARGKTTVSAPFDGIVAARDGTPVALSFSGELPADDSWKGSPEAWPMLTGAAYGQLLDGFAKTSAAALPRVSMTFRSPRQDSGGGGGRGRFRGMSDEDAEDRTMTEWNGTGILLDDKRVLIPAGFKTKTTGRLLSIKVFIPGQDKPVTAKFGGTLKDYGALVGLLDTPVKGAAPIYLGNIVDLRDQLLLKDEISVLGETRTAYSGRERIGSYYLSWHRQVLPSASVSREYRGGGGGSSTSGNFLFTTDGKLVAAPIERREKVTVEARSGGYGGEYPVMLPIQYLLKAIDDKAGGYDEQNRPMTEAEENRLAWLGAELQPMDPDLARLNNVADQTAGGRFGGIVTYVYPDSPASKADLAVGDIVLRLKIDGQPKPLDVQAGENTGFGNMMDQFWQMVDQIPEEYFDRMPKPWGSAETPVTRALTDVGFGTAFQAEIFRDGKLLTKPFKVEQGPNTYDAAARLKHEASGISARDLTFEVRRYFQIEPAEAGVIVSKVEKGSRAAIAGIKPYEIITSVDDQPMKTVADLEAALNKAGSGGELKLSVKRMTEGRVVKLKLK